jgi:formate hydrogenlyase subunit 6/NADH:ubiquinone oxidoreductase subunit I
MSDDIYRRLQERLDLFSMGFPATDSGIELKILRHLFSEEDAAMFLSLSHNLETPEAVAQRLGQAEDAVAAQLDAMAERGLLFRLKKENGSRYGAIPFVHGLFEFQVKNLDRELAEMVEQYFEAGFDTAMQKGADYFLRPIPVHQSIDARQHVASYDDALAILRSKPRIVVTDCICRKRKEVVGQGCGKPLEACFMFGSMGQYYLDRGIGREISFEEAAAIMDQCREAGLVTQPATAQNPSGMCNCCSDCCGVLTALNKHPRPVELVIANHLAEVSEEDCTGCETCLERCQMGALEMTDEATARVDPDRCIGCGLCVVSCPAEAITLRAKPEEVTRVPPTSMAEQMMLMAQKRGLV